MASAAEQMASNISWSTFGKAKDLQSRILFALGLLIVYRIGTYIPVPGIDAVQLAQFFEQASQGIGGMLNMFTGRRGRAHGDLRPRHHALHLGLDHRAADDGDGPLARPAEEGGRGRPQEDQPVHPLRHGLPRDRPGLRPVGRARGEGLAVDPGWFFRMEVVITLVGGTMFLMWLGEQITARGIGNGISLIIFVGIIAELPAALAQFFTQGRTGAISPVAIVGIL
jgi:preprotein translocase subunit SecY